MGTKGPLNSTYCLLGGHGGRIQSTSIPPGPPRTFGAPSVVLLWFVTFEAETWLVVLVEGQWDWRPQPQIVVWLDVRLGEDHRFSASLRPPLERRDPRLRMSS